MSELDYYASKLSNLLTRIDEAKTLAEKVQLSILLASFYREGNEIFTHEQIVMGLEMIEEVNA
jgi:hypothetical protein